MTDSPSKHVTMSANVSPPPPAPPPPPPTPTINERCRWPIFLHFSQLGEDTFNRAKLLNVGYTEALKDAEYDCFIFSDVDLIPMDDRNLYHCYDQPRHFAIAMDKFGFRWAEEAQSALIFTLLLDFQTFVKASLKFLWNQCVSKSQTTAWLPNKRDSLL